ncbi:MAG: putative manganese-dependent inorganic diphosphatase [Bacilli bacterium]|nr:putative manganese-dependent inorganic diphosphatase [Bacilli bacterium]
MCNTYVIGHKNPDTDSVTSAISLAYLKHKLGIEVEPRVLGAVNPETQFALNTFNVKTPQYLNDVKIQIKDVDFSRDHVINEDAPIIDAFNYMHENGITGIPLVDKDNYFKGYVSLKEIAADMIYNESLYVDTSFDNLIKVLDADSYYKVDDHIEGFAHAATFDDATFIKDVPLDNKSILIVGDRKQIIEHALKVGVKLIIMVHAKQLTEQQMKIAAENNINIISSNKSSFKIARVLCLANPIKSIQREEKCTTVGLNDYLTDVEDIVAKLKHTNYPVVTGDNKCVGMIRTLDLKKVNKKKVILVDHNTTTQTVDGLYESEIVEIVDHHNLGDIVTSTPINIRSMSVGSTNTIIYHMYKENNIEIPKDIAGLMLSGILSDTLCLKSPTTTKVDIEIANALAKIAEVEVDKYGLDLLESGVSIKGLNADDIIFKDSKRFETNGHEFSVSQVFTTNFDEFKPRVNELIAELNKEAERNNLEVCALFVTDFLTNNSYLLYSDNSKNLLENAYNVGELEQGHLLEGVVSRKKQMVPVIMEVLSN